MSILESFNCGTPIMLRNLDLYDSIIKGSYIGVENIRDMQQKIDEIMADPSYLAPYRKQSLQFARAYSEKKVAGIWREYYLQAV